MLVVVGRSVLGMTVAPTIDLFRGRPVTYRDYVPFLGASKSDYGMDDFAKDLGYTAVGGVVAATPWTVLVGTEVLTASSVSAGTAAVATGAVGFVGLAAATAYTAHLINELEPGTEEYSLMSSMAWNLNMSAY